MSWRRAVKEFGRGPIILWITLMSGVLSLIREVLFASLAATGKPVPPSQALAVFGHLSLFAFIVCGLWVVLSQRGSLQAMEQRKELATKYERIADTLQERDNWAVHNILNHHPAFDSVEGDKALADWCKTVEKALSDAGASFVTVSHFAVLGEVEQRYAGKWINELSLKRTRLKDIIQDYTKKAEQAGM